MHLQVTQSQVNSIQFSREPHSRLLLSTRVLATTINPFGLSVSPALGLHTQALFHLSGLVGGKLPASESWSVSMLNSFLTVTLFEGHLKHSCFFVGGVDGFPVVGPLPVEGEAPEQDHDKVVFGAPTVRSSLGVTWGLGGGTR